MESRSSESRYTSNTSQVVSFGTSSSNASKFLNNLLEKYDILASANAPVEADTIMKDLIMLSKLVK